MNLAYEVFQWFVRSLVLVSNKNMLYALFLLSYNGTLFRIRLFNSSVLSFLMTGAHTLVWFGLVCVTPCQSYTYGFIALLLCLDTHQVPYTLVVVHAQETVRLIRLVVVIMNILSVNFAGVIALLTYTHTHTHFLEIKLLERCSHIFYSLLFKHHGYKAIHD